VAVPPSLAPGRFKKWSGKLSQATPIKLPQHSQISQDYQNMNQDLPRKKHDGSCHRFRNYVPLYRGPASLQSQKSRSWLDEIMLWWMVVVRLQL
jgi:hypothetical protein